jgi:hypothetical protein
MRLIRPAAAALAVAVAATTFVPTADARHRRHHDAFIAGAAGFAAGAFLSAITAPRYPYYYDDYYYDDDNYYYDDYPGTYYAPGPVYVSPPVYAPRRFECDNAGAISPPPGAMC